MKFAPALALIIFFFSIKVTHAEKPRTSFYVSAKNRIIEDQRIFYRSGNIIKLMGGLGASGILAHTSSDRDVQKYVRKNFVNNGTESAANISKTFGEGKIFIPLYSFVSGAGWLLKRDESKRRVYDWSNKSLRAVITGAPPLLLLQRAVGGSRPNDNPSDTKWNAFNDSNGLGGHSFMGAIPFLTAAKMSRSFSAKSLYYTASTFSALSRVHDDAHYLSQAFMGWWLAVISVNSINSQEKTSIITIMPMPVKGGAGIMVSFLY